MKKIMILIFLVVAMFVLAGCGSEDSSDDQKVGSKEFSGKTKPLPKAKEDSLKSAKNKGLVGHAGATGCNANPNVCDGNEICNANASNTGTCELCQAECTVPSWVGDTYCDDGKYSNNGQPVYCNSAACGYDGGDCPVPTVLTSEEKAQEDACKAKGCPLNYVGDTFCDDTIIYEDDCFNKECNWDTEFGKDPKIFTDCPDKASLIPKEGSDLVTTTTALCFADQIAYYAGGFGNKAEDSDCAKRVLQVSGSVPDYIAGYACVDVYKGVPIVSYNGDDGLLHLGSITYSDSGTAFPVYNWNQVCGSYLNSANKFPSDIDKDLGEAKKCIDNIDSQAGWAKFYDANCQAPSSGGSSGSGGSSATCVPNSKMCTDDSGSVLTCKEDGSGFSELACDSGKTCSEGACVAPLTCNVGESVGKKCVQEGAWNYYAEHKYNAACQLEPVKNNNGYFDWQDGCGSATCEEGKGCCNTIIESTISKCVGTDYYNGTFKTACDPTVKDQVIDCSGLGTCFEGTGRPSNTGCATCGKPICEATVEYLGDWDGEIKVGDKTVLSSYADTCETMWPKEPKWKQVGTVQC